MKLFDSKEDWKQFLLLILYGLAVIVATALLCGCKTKYVPVPEVHHEYHHTTDSVFHTDSIIDRQTTIIREVDSLTMAQYGITLKNMERAWLVQSDKLYKEIERLKQLKRDTIEVRDSINVPYPVEVVKEVTQPLKQWQKGLIWWGVICLVAIILYIIVKIRFPKAL